MPAAPEICFMTAIELARRARSKELSAREVLEARLIQIERVNPKVNAIVPLTPEFGAGSQAYNEVFGDTLNPYDPTKTYGGSSGGLIESRPALFPGSTGLASVRPLPSKQAGC